MFQARPKRKATINKSYNDKIDEAMFEESNSSSSVPDVTIKRKGSVKSSSPIDAKNGTTGNSRNSVKYNWQPPPEPTDYFSQRLNLEDAYIDLENQALFCPNHPLSNNPPTVGRKRKIKPIFQLKKGDYIYMISEPPGEPYYIGRIMGFTGKSNSSNDDATTEELNHPYVDANNYQFQIQWFYRPRDISKTTSDSRLLFASMHSDSCPLSSFRGVATVLHKQDIENDNDVILTKNDDDNSNSNNSLSRLEMYSQQPNCFYFDKLFDRYMVKFYDILSTSYLLQLSRNEESKSRNFLAALHKRFEYIFVESQRTKSLIEGFKSDSCNCEKCGQWCSTQDSVRCATCDKFFHMLCLDPPLLKKPSRGFSWSCASCTKKHDLEHRSKKMLMLSHDNKSSNEKELTNELSGVSSVEEFDEVEEKTPESVLPKYELMAIEFLKSDEHLTFEQRRLKEEWSMRYLGMHSRLEDGVDLDDRSPYPRASTRLGAKHQATNIPEYCDHPIVYYDEDKTTNGNAKKKTSTTKKKGRGKEEADVVQLNVPDEYKDVSPKDYPQWLKPRPKGYIERGVDDGEGITCSLLWKSSESDIEDHFNKLDNYIDNCSPIATKLKIHPNSPNFMDAIVKNYMMHNGDAELAFKDSSKLTRRSLKEPTFTKDEVKKFEAGVEKYGSELYNVFKEVKTQPCAMVVRYYYLWKKTKNGKLIWGNFEGRMQKKLQNVKEDVSSAKKDKDNNGRVLDHLADPEDDSSFEDEKIIENNEIFNCKHCHTNQSIKWYRITGNDSNIKTDPNLEAGSETTVTGLCFRCARLWRRYAVVWEDPNEVEKKNSKGTSGWKKKVESELVIDALKILAEAESQNSSLSYENPVVVKSSIIQENGRPKKIIPPKKDLKVTGILGKKKSPKKADTKKEKIPQKSDKPGRKKITGSTKLPKAGDEPPSKGPKIQKQSKVKAESKKVDQKSVKKEVSSAVKEKKTGEKESKKITEKETKKETRKDIKKDLKKDVKKETNRKRKKETEEPSQNGNGDSFVEASSFYVPVVPNKRQKKSSIISRRVINPILNSNYSTSAVGRITKVDKKSFSPLSKDKLSDIVHNFKLRQLMDVTSQLSSIQLPHLSSVELPFGLYDRKCCVCKEHETCPETESDMLICSHCGVNVHGSCVGLFVSDKVPRPVKEWLCEVCINDLNSHFNALYTCSLCLANETNYELSILGSSLVRPDFLKPIHESGKWCHLICAIYNHEMVNFRSTNSNSHHFKRSLKDDVSDYKSVIESIQNFVSIECVSEIYLKNYLHKCSICNTYNGSLISCDVCESLGLSYDKYHVTCAQDSPNFKLGFKLETGTLDEKDYRLTRIGDKYGNLKPILVCPKHDQSTSTIYNIRTLGRRIYGSNKEETKPLIHLFLEEITKTNVDKLTGPQFRSSKYITNSLIFKEEEQKSTLSNQYYKLFNQANSNDSKSRPDTKTCARCKTSVSPMWWVQNLPSSSDREAHLCQNCYHLINTEDENGQDEVHENPAQALVEQLNQPLDGSIYGLENDKDSIMDIYTPGLVNIEKLSSQNGSRSRISIGDILS